MAGENSSSPGRILSLLKERARNLEARNARLRRRVQKLRKMDRDYASVCEKDRRLADVIAQRGRMLLENASDVILELRSVTNENQCLRKELDCLRDQLAKGINEDQSFLDRSRWMACKKRKICALIEDYERLLTDICSSPLDSSLDPPLFSSAAMPLVTHSLPATVQHVVQIIEDLPIRLNSQTLEKRRESMEILGRARCIAVKMAEEINLISIGSRCDRRSQDDIGTKQAYLTLLCRAISKRELTWA
jgi:hypothetical protein